MKELDHFNKDVINEEDEKLQPFVDIQGLTKCASMLQGGSDNFKEEIESVVRRKKLQYKRESGFIEV